ncbi:DNA polymerase III subunit delta' [Sphingobacterium psychroaquaticum]|uniref:DNA polymerase III subunit n=1 Tax=Sphingobacterium psychroaquaticum TaxID=561061 RepID=UPI00106D2E4C|nr:DNA polymerase III subunit delta' [Sphingobacterium psychroaquaticum]QBQ39639.1 DNA polymerase III subunit delta' [Sphingobacterium psychroaquaticum]
MHFKEIIGHQQVKDHLLQTVQDNRVSHAQLFLGPEGSGSLALALAYAQYINCENPSPTDSCGQCSACLKYQKLIHPDLHFSYPFFASGEKDVATVYVEEWRKAFLENPYLGLTNWRNQLDAGNKQANINIAEAHDIIKKLSLKSFEAEYKVLIMWLPEYLDVQGNALLKLIEEPPAKTLFLLVAENQDKILNTIISRTQLVKIFKLGHQDVKSFLIADKGLSEERAHEIAFIADGNIQTAIDLLEEDTNPYFNLLINWLRFVVTDAGLQLIRTSEEDLSKLGRENQKNFLIYAINMLRQIVLLQQGLHDLVLIQGQELDFVKKFSDNFQLEQLEAAIELLEKTHYKVERNANPKILFLDLSLQLVLIFKYKTIPQGTQYI